MKTVNLQPELQKAIEEMKYTEFTDIQVRSIPLIQEGRDVLGQSFTGSGKTAAFGLPLLEKIEQRAGIQALILVPTRELAEQVTNELKKFSKYRRREIISIYGGVSINPQFSNLRRAEVVVATPGRMLDHMERGTVRLDKVKFFVLDEADKMFEMGFIDDVKRIVSQVPKNRQTLLFSATMSQDVMNIVKHYMKNPERIKVQTHVDQGKLLQYYYNMHSKDKFSFLHHFLKKDMPKLSIIFCATRNRVDIVSKNLYKQGIENTKLHGGLTQNRRKKSIEDFHNNKVSVLVASDVAARGLDIKNVSHIINYDIPKTSKEYIHRIGRTARAGVDGIVISFLSEQDHENMRNVMDDRSIVIEELQLPDFERVHFDANRQSDFRGGSRGRFGNRGGGRRFGGNRGQGGYRGHSGGRSGGYRGNSGGYGGSGSRYSGGDGDSRRSYGNPGSSGESSEGNSSRGHSGSRSFGHGRRFNRN